MSNMSNAILISNMMSIDNCPKDKLIKCFKKSNHQMYTILSYDKNYICYNDLYTGLYRSVVFSFPDKKLLSYSPSKSTTFNYFQNLFPNLNEDILITEYIDGIMVQLFYDERIHRWEIATKDNIGGYEKYPNDLLYRTIESVFNDLLGGMPNEDINFLPFLEYFSKDCSYTFIIDQNQIYLVAVYLVKSSIPGVVKYIPDIDYTNWECIQCIKGIISFPKKYTYRSYNDIYEEIQCMQEPFKYILTNIKTGVKCSIQNNEFTLNHRLKKMPNFDKFMFFCLNRICKTYDVCKIIIEYQINIYFIKQNYEFLINILHQYYINYFIKKKSLELSCKYKKHLMYIHKEIYIPSIKTKKPILIGKKIIKEYMDGLSPNELMHIFNL